MPQLEALLQRALDLGAAELRVVSGRMPVIIGPDDIPYALSSEPQGPEAVQALVAPLLDDDRRAALQAEGEVGLVVRVGDYRFRVLLTQRGPELTLRARPMAIPPRLLGDRPRDRDLKLQRVLLRDEQLQRLSSGGLASTVDQLLDAMAEHEASDLHLRRGHRPCFRISGVVLPLEQLDPLEEYPLEQTVKALLTPRQLEALERELAIDFAHRSPGGGRFRVNIFHESGTLGLAARRVTTDIPTFETLNLPPRMSQVPELLEGLVLICGVTGSGKSTTLAAIVEVVNRTRRCNIVTLEDPIEYAYTGKQALIAQREVGIDCLDWSQGLRHVLRQDPDVILIGEMRDAETFETALQATETGHLVLSTLHTSSAAQVPGRMLELFPAAQHGVVRQSLASNLRAVVCQRLLPSREGGMIPAVEFLLINPAVRKLIREGRDHIIDDVIISDDEMLSFDQSLHQLIVDGAISPTVGYEYSYKPERLRMMLKGIRLDDERRGAIGQ